MKEIMMNVLMSDSNNGIQLYTRRPLKEAMKYARNLVRERKLEMDDFSEDYDIPAGSCFFAEGKKECLEFLSSQEDDDEVVAIVTDKELKEIEEEHSVHR